MRFEPITASHGSPVPGVIPEPVRVHEDTADPQAVADASTEALLDADRRWVNEGGSFEAEVVPPRSATSRGK